MSHRIYKMSFAGLYQAYLNKVERKGRTKDELDEVIRWFTGHTQESLDAELTKETIIEDFVAGAPALNPNRLLIKGVVCGVRVEEVEEELMRELRYMDKLVDELAKGRVIGKILRS